MKVSSNKYAYRSSGVYKSYFAPANHADDAKYTSNNAYDTDDIDDPLYGEFMHQGSMGEESLKSSAVSINPSANNTSAKNKSFQKEYIPTEYINLDEETKRSYYDEKYYSEHRKSDTTETTQQLQTAQTMQGQTTQIKKIQCLHSSNFCVIRKFAVIELDSFIYESGADLRASDNTDSADEKSANSRPDITLMLTLRLMEFTNPNCANYYTMLKHREMTNFEKNYLLLATHNNGPNSKSSLETPNLVDTNDLIENNDLIKNNDLIETYDLFVVASEIKNSNRIHETTSPHMDKPVTIYFTPEINTEYVSFRLRNHLNSYILLDLRQNRVYITGETSAMARDYCISSQIYNKKIETESYLSNYLKSF